MKIKDFPKCQKSASFQILHINSIITDNSDTAPLTFRSVLKLDFGPSSSSTSITVFVLRIFCHLKVRYRHIFTELLSVHMCTRHRGDIDKISILRDFFDLKNPQKTSSSCYCPESGSGPSSVMELLRPEDRERLLNLRNSSNVPSTKTTTLDSHDALRPAGTSAGPPAVGDVASSGLQQEALAAWRGVRTSSQTFRPFEKNPSKQARYELYLNRLKQGDKGRRPSPTCPIMHCRSVCLLFSRHISNRV